MRLLYVSAFILFPLFIFSQDVPKIDSTKVDGELLEEIVLKKKPTRMKKSLSIEVNANYDPNQIVNPMMPTSPGQDGKLIIGGKIQFTLQDKEKNK